MNAPAQSSEGCRTVGAEQGSCRAARKAVIDIGTNAVKMLVADVSGQTVLPVLETNEQTRLGRGLYASQTLRTDSIEATAFAVGRFAERARGAGATQIRVIATSAVREARNAPVLLRAIIESSGLAVEVISGETEADLAFRGVTLNSGFGADAVMILDVGGGSTEIILGRGTHCVWRQSFPLGAVRMLEAANLTDPPGLDARQKLLAETKSFLLQNTVPAVAPHLTGNTPRLLVGTGGSATILARIKNRLVDFDRDAIEACRLGLADVHDQVSRLWTASLRQRQATPGLPPERADIIIMGAVIYEAVMETFGVEELRVSTRGLRFAAVL